MNLFCTFIFDVLSQKIWNCRRKNAGLLIRGSSILLEILVGRGDAIFANSFDHPRYYLLGCCTRFHWKLLIKFRKGVELNYAGCCRFILAGFPNFWLPWRQDILIRKFDVGNNVQFLSHLMFFHIESRKRKKLRMSLQHDKILKFKNLNRPSRERSPDFIAGIATTAWVTVAYYYHVHY